MIGEIKMENQLMSFEAMSEEQLSRVQGGKGKGFGKLMGIDWLLDQAKDAVKQYNKDYKRWH